MDDEDTKEQEEEEREYYTVFVIQAYEAQTPQGDLMDLCVLEMIDNSLDKAMERAKQLVTKKFYRLNRVIEKFVT